MDVEETIEELKNEVAQEDKKREKALRHQYKYKETYGAIFYSDIPTKAKCLKGIDGAAVTQMNLDKTLTLEALVSEQLPDKDACQLLGELQFAFVTFVLGENYDSFSQWKSLLLLLCGCREAMIDKVRRDLFFQMVPVLYAQVEQLPPEFLVEAAGEDAEDINNMPLTDGTNNFISHALTDLIRTALEPEVSPQIRKRVLKLQELLVSKFGMKAVQTEQDRIL